MLQKLRVDIPSVRLKVDGLSGGRQQTLAIARAISFNPKVIVLNEATANLSVPAITRVLELIGRGGRVHRELPRALAPAAQ